MDYFEKHLNFENMIWLLPLILISLLYLYKVNRYKESVQDDYDGHHISLVSKSMKERDIVFELDKITEGISSKNHYFINNWFDAKTSLMALKADLLIKACDVRQLSYLILNSRDLTLVIDVTLSKSTLIYIVEERLSTTTVNCR